MNGSFNRNINSGCNQNRQTVNYMGSQNRQTGMQINMPSSCCAKPVATPYDSRQDCDCMDNNTHMRHFKPGMAYVPIQEWGDLYDLETAHCEGTIFPDLNFIFCGSRGKM